jgi:Iap family predicted aminopeptidase
VNLKGKIALVRRGEISNTDKIAYAAKAGALAVLLYNNLPQEFLSFNWGGPAAIPALWLSGADGEKLLASLNTGPVMMRLDSETVHAQREGINIVATRPGKSNKTLVFGAHYDSVTNNSLGANDNASGVAVVLELARVLAQADRPETLVFIGFDGEEEGTLGSQAYVQQLTSKQRHAVQIMFNFDEVGAGDCPFGFGGNRALAKKAVKAAVQRGLKINAAFSEGGGSDHSPFVSAGIDTLWIFQDFPFFHSALDSPEKINPDGLAASGNIALDLLKE